MLATDLEPLPTNLFWQLICLLIVVGWLAGTIIRAVRGTDQEKGEDDGEQTEDPRHRR